MGHLFPQRETSAQTTGLPERSKPCSGPMRKWHIASGALLLLVVTIAYGLRPRVKRLLRDHTVRILQTHFASQVEFSDFEVSLFPRARVTINQLVLRHRGRSDVPPLIQVRRVTLSGNLTSLCRAEPRIALVQLEGLEIRMPPRKAGDEPLIRGTDQDLHSKYPALIEEIRADDAVLFLLPKEAEKSPQAFPIHHLKLRDVSFDRPATFRATLTNRVPIGEIDSTGEFGPWNAEEPSKTPAIGRYSFQNADLGTIKGIQGILSSEGKFNGPLDYLDVEGATDTPNFSLRTAAHPMSLHTDFSAVVDGTNGNTYLNRVTARFLHSTLVVSGKVVDANREIRGRTIVLDAVSGEARVEDLIRIAVKTNEPVLTGSAKLKVRIEIPEGNSDFIGRLRLQGKFWIAGGQFTRPEVQDKVDILSRKAQGQPKQMDINSVPSKMTGAFHVEDSVVTFSELRFDVDGAAINLNGTYCLDDGGLDFHGRLLMQAKLSQTMTGAKSFFLKALDPFFKGKDAGSVLAIKVSGTKDKPAFGLDHGGAPNNPPPSTVPGPANDRQENPP